MLPDNYYIESDWVEPPDFAGIRSVVIVQLSDSHSDYPNYYNEYCSPIFISTVEIERNKLRLAELKNAKLNNAKIKLFETIKEHNNNKMFFDENGYKKINITNAYIFNNDSGKWELLDNAIKEINNDR